MFSNRDDLVHAVEHSLDPPSSAAVLGEEQHVRTSHHLYDRHADVLPQPQCRFAVRVLCDAETISGHETYDGLEQESAGVNGVVVNGRVAFQDGVHTQAAAGHMLRYRRSAWTGE